MTAEKTRTPKAGNGWKDPARELNAKARGRLDAAEPREAYGGASSLLALFCRRRPKSGSKLHAVHTLRDLLRASTSSQPATMFDYCTARELGREEGHKTWDSGRGGTSGLIGLALGVGQN